MLRDLLRPVIAVGAVVCGVLALAGCGSVSDATSGATTRRGPDAAPLVGTEWQLVSFHRSGRTVRVPSEVDSVLRFDGAGGFSGSACNSFSGQARVTAKRVVLGRLTVSEMACYGLPAQVQDAFWAMSPGELRWSIRRGRLALVRQDGDALTYRVRSSPYPNASSRTMDVGDIGEHHYRLSVDGSGTDLALVLESRERPGTPWGVHVVGAPAPRESAMWALNVLPIGPAVFVAGFAPADAVRVTHGAGAAAVELRLHELAGSTWQVFGGVVQEHSRATGLTAQDAERQVVASWPSGP